MKLHLPKMLTAALLAAFAVPSTFAGNIDQNSTLNLDDNILYNGYIYNFVPKDGSNQFHEGTRYQYVRNGDHMEQTTTTTPWQSFANNQSQTYGHTLRLTGTESDSTVNTDFSPFSLGGLIVEAGAGTYTLGRAGSTVDFNGVGDVNLNIKGSIKILGNLDKNNVNGIIFYKGGLWNVANGKTLTFQAPDRRLTLTDGLSIDIQGGGTVEVNSVFVGGVGATINVGSGSTMKFDKAATLGGTITNNGTVNFGGAVSLTDSLSGFESVENGHYVDYTGTEAQNGYYQGTTDYTLVKGNAASGLTSVTHGGKQYTVTDGKITVGSASDIDKTTYHLLTSGASVNVGTELANNSQLVKVVQSAGTTVDLGGATLATLEGATSGEAMKIAGTGTISALTKTGVLDMQSGASVTVPNLTVADAMGTYSTGAGKLVMETVNLNANSSQIEFDSATQITTAQLTGGAITFGGSGITHSVTNLKLSQEGQRVSTVNVEAGTTLHITGTAVSDTQPNRFAGSFSVSHWNAANVLNVNGTLISEAVVSSCDGTATINVNSGGRLEMRDGLNRGNYNNNAITINVASGATLAAGTTHNTTQTKNSDTMVVNMAAGSIFEAYYGNGDTAIINKTLTFDGGISSINTGAAAGKTMILNSNLSTDANLFVYGEGELRLAGGNNVLGHAIGLYSGTLSMTGTFNIDALEVSGEETTWDRAEGIAEGSGFKKVSGTVTVVSIEDGTLNAAGATLIREGATVQLADTGTVTLSGTANYTTLWVNNIGAVSYDVAQTLAGEINVGTVRLEAEGATVTMDKADAAVDIVVADGVNAGVKATQDTTINSITGLGADKAITISGEGTVSLSQDPAITASNVAVNGGHLELGGARHMINLSVTNGTATTTHHGNNPCISGTLTINEGGVFTVAGEGQDAFGYSGGDTSNMDIYLAGKDGNHAELALNQQTTDTVTMSANLHFGGYADVTSTSTGFNTFGGQISVTGVDNTITNMQLRKAVTVTVAGEGVLTINNMTRFSGFNDGLTKEGAGKLVFNGTNVLDKTIQVNAGSLELNGTYSIGGIADVDSYGYDGGEQEGNGFLTTTHTKNLYALAQGASGSIGEGAVFKIGETDVTDKVENGAYSTSSTDDSVFYVNTGTEKVSTARTSQNLVGIMMLGDNTTLTVDDNLASSEVEAYGTNVTLNIGSGYTVAGQVSGFVLDGTGTYVISGLNNVNASLGTGVTLADSWAGTVKFSGCTTLMNINLNNLGKNGSAVEFDGVTGYFEAPQSGIDFTNKLVLSGSGLEIVNGSSPRTYTFSGGVAGAGDFIYSMRSGATNQTYVFNADVKDWTGAFKSTNAGKTGTLQFLGNATEVGAAIVHDAGTLTVEVGNGSDAFTTTFDQAVGATTLNVKSSAEATVKGALDVTTANVAGGLTVAGVDSNIATLNLTGDFAIAEGGSVTLGTVAVTGTETTMSGAGTAVLTSAIALNEGSLTMSGVYNIDAFEYQGESTIEGGEHAGNGFATEKGTITVVTKAAETTLSATGASIVRGGNTFSLADDGTAALNSANYAAFYITNLSETVTRAKSKEEESGVALASIHVATGAALDVDQSINLSLVSAETGAKLNILSGQTVSVGDATTTATIAGEGTYALKSGSKNMTGTLAEGADWTGTVAVSNVSISDINLNSYGHEGSKVAMDGVSGYFLQAQAVFAPELVLEGAGLTLNNGFSTMPSGNPKPPTTYTFAGGVSGEGDMTFNRPVAPSASTVTQHLYFTGDVMNWTGSLNVVSLFNVYAQYSGADQKVNSTISRTGGELHVEVGTGSDASVVTFSKAITADDLTVKAGATAIINGGLSTNTITVGDGATLVINGNTTLTSAITSAGTVTLTNVALSNTFEAQEGGEKQYFVESTANYYLGTAYEYLDVVTGTGAANATGTGLTWGGQEALTMAAGQVKVSDHGTASYDTLYIGQDTTTAQIALYDNIGSLANIVVKNGKLTVGEGDIQQPVTISVIEHGTISGDVAPEEVEIGSGAIAEFTKPVETEAIRFSAAEDGTVKVTNNGDSAAAYSMLNTQQTVAAKTLELLVPEMVMVANDVDVDEIVNAQAGGVLSLTNAESVEIKSMTIGEDAIVQMTYKDEEQVVQEGTVTITESLVAGGGTLYANLTLVGHELGDETPNLLYWDLNGAGENALTLGSTLTLDTETGLIQLDNDTMQAIAALETRGDYLELVVDAGTGLEYFGDGWFDGVFSRTYTNADGVESTLGGDYNVQLLENGNFGIVKFSNVPEPTTGTLSLLALAALAARRRKHN